MHSLRSHSGQSLLGDFEFFELEQTQWIMGPMFFIMFIGTHMECSE